MLKTYENPHFWHKNKFARYNAIVMDKKLKGHVFNIGIFQNTSKSASLPAAFAHFYLFYKFCIKTPGTKKYQKIQKGTKKYQQV